MAESNKNKHMTADERGEIESCLNKGITFKDIGRRIGKHPTTVSKDVKKHLATTPSVSRITDGNGNPAVCPLLLKPPFCCNPCKRRHGNCGYQKQIYRAKPAQQEYETLLKEAREGIPLNKESFYEIDALVSGGVKKGQHLYQIIKSNDIKRSKSSLYRDVKRGYLSISPTDLPRMVKFKQRKANRAAVIPRGVKIGRTYNDFLKYTEENGITDWVEMDTVIGRVGGKVILTFDFTICNFMFGILLDNKTALEVSEKIKELKSRLSDNTLSFGDIFPLALTDNGGEFADVFAIENKIGEETKETSLYFCDPYRSCQKAKVEKNHTLFRDIVPQGKSFDDFTQETVNLIFSHVNGVKRKRFNGRAPYDMFCFLYGERISELLGIRKIDAKDVIQSPKLLTVK